MYLSSDTSLKPYNTFGINVSCAFFAKIKSKEDIASLSAKQILHELPHFIIGGGSNLLFTKDYEGLIIKADVQFIEICHSDPEYVWIKAGAGVVWDDLIRFTLDHNLCGVENLIGIPGTVGASAFQNIGAYGREAKDCIEEVEVINLKSGESTLFSNKQCVFGYRNSIFKQKNKASDFIYSVTYKLSKKPLLTLSYGSIQKELEKEGISTPSIQDIAFVIQKIRTEKLPSVKVLGSAGSFFKNPVISKEEYEVLKKAFPSIVSFPNSENAIKISAGWLIEQCGWKGKTLGKAGVYEKQALILVNLGNCTGAEIKELAENIRNSVIKTFGISLEPEVIYI